MINQTLIWLLALPICLAVVIWLCSKSHHGAWKIAVGYGVIALAVVLGGFFVSKGVQTSDTEIWNGQVTSKNRQHGSYVRSYECHCRTDSKGNRSCMTCYEDHYTVEWTCNTTAGENFTIDSKDWTSRAVYYVPDPSRYTVIKPGDPVASRHSYVNYVQAVPNSLFTPSSADLKATFAKLIPPYPDDVYDFYKLNRFITPGWSVPDAAQWNEDISLGLRERGPKKQVNTIIVIAKTADPNYEYALRDAWEGVNKNDVLLLIGSTEYPKIDFVRVISWTKNETFKIELRDVVMEKGTIDRSIVTTMMAQIDKNFERRHMREFAYLEGEIDPPTWLVIVLIVIVTAGAVGTWIYIPRLTA